MEDSSSNNNNKCTNLDVPIAVPTERTSLLRKRRKGRTRGREGRNKMTTSGTSTTDYSNNSNRNNSNSNDGTNNSSNRMVMIMPPEGERSLDDFLEYAYQSTKQGNGRNGINLFTQWKYWGLMLSLGMANSSDASEILCISYILSDREFNEHILQESAWRGGLLAAAVFLGMLIGGLFIGTLGDWLGRRPMLLVGLLCNTIAGVLSAAAPDALTLSFLRCIAGIGIGATVPPLFTLVTELAPPSQRGLFVTVCASFWMVGSIYVALVALWLLESLGLSWRVFAVACAVPSAIGGFLIYMIVPESPRFLALEQKHTDALRVTLQLANLMGYDGPSLTLTEMERSFPRSSSQSIQSLSHAEEQQRQRGGGGGIFSIMSTAMTDFYVSASKLYTKDLRQTTWPLQMVWFSLSFGSYGLLTWINSIFVQEHLKNVYFNALLFAASNLPGNILTAILMDRIGRSIMLISSVVASASCLVSFAWSAYVTSQAGIVLSACAFQCFTIAAWNTIDCMTSELFPTTVRSTGMGVCAASGRIGAMVAQFVNGALIAQPIRLLLVASVTLLLGALTPCLLPEGDMTGQPVQDDVVVDTMVGQQRLLGAEGGGGDDIDDNAYSTSSEQHDQSMEYGKDATNSSSVTGTRSRNISYQQNQPSIHSVV